MASVVKVEFIENENKYFCSDSLLIVKGSIIVTYSDGKTEVYHQKNIEDQWELQVHHRLRTQESVDREKKSILYTEDLLKPLDNLLNECTEKKKKYDQEVDNLRNESIERKKKYDQEKIALKK
jgi:hypothetical protein